VIFSILKKPLQPLTYKLIFSTVITVLIAVVYKMFDFEKFNFKIYGFCFLITATLLIITHFFQKKSVCVSPKEISTKHAALVGLIQGVAVIPGISRSGSTISTLILCGNDEKKTAEFSFLMSIPIIVGGFVLELFEIFSKPQTTNLFASINMIKYLFAFVLTFVVAFIALKLTIKILKNNKFIYFSIYLYMIGILVVLLNFV
jgi:undecaprenyl-diphosphatase